MAFLSYFAGTFPTGYLIAKRLKGIDIREHGSGNPGAANVYAVVGKGAGAATFAGDALKGLLAVLASRHLSPGDDRYWAFCGALAICGHVWNVFLGFRGGKAVATGFGVFLGLAPLSALIGLGLFGLGVEVTGYAAIGSIFAALSLPLSTEAFGCSRPIVILAAGGAVLAVVRHASNLKRLARGEETRDASGRLADRLAAFFRR